MTHHPYALLEHFAWSSRISRTLNGLHPLLPPSRSLLWYGTVFSQMKVGPSLSLSLHHNCCAPPQVLSAGMITSHSVIFNNCSSLLWVSPHCRYCCSLPQWPLLTCPSPRIKTLPLPPFHFFSLHTSTSLQIAGFEHFVCTFSLFLIHFLTLVVTLLSATT
jgi:hypothetical protein